MANIKAYIKRVAPATAIDLPRGAGIVSELPKTYIMQYIEHQRWEVGNCLEGDGYGISTLHRNMDEAEQSKYEASDISVRISLLEPIEGSSFIDLPYPYLPDTPARPRAFLNKLPANALWHVFEYMTIDYMAGFTFYEFGFHDYDNDITFLGVIDQKTIKIDEKTGLATFTAYSVIKRLENIPADFITKIENLTDDDTRRGWIRTISVEDAIAEIDTALNITGSEYVRWDDINVDIETDTKIGFAIYFFQPIDFTSADLAAVETSLKVHDFQYVGTGPTEGFSIRTENGNQDILTVPNLESGSDYIYDPLYQPWLTYAFRSNQRAIPFGRLAPVDMVPESLQSIYIPELFKFTHIGLGFYFLFRDASDDFWYIGNMKFFVKYIEDDFDEIWIFGDFYERSASGLPDFGDDFVGTGVLKGTIGNYRIDADAYLYDLDFELLDETNIIFITHSTISDSAIAGSYQLAWIVSDITRLSDGDIILFLTQNQNLYRVILDSDDTGTPVTEPDIEIIQDCGGDISQLLYFRNRFEIWAIVRSLGGGFQKLYVRSSNTGNSKYIRNPGAIPATNYYDNYNLNWESIDFNSLIEIQYYTDFESLETGIGLAGVTNQSPFKFFILDTNISHCVYYVNLSEALNMEIENVYITRRYIEKEVAGEMLYYTEIWGIATDGTIGNTAVFAFQMTDSGQIRILNLKDLTAAGAFGELAKCSGAVLYDDYQISEASGELDIIPRLNIISRGKLIEHASNFYIDGKWIEFSKNVLNKDFFFTLDINFNTGKTQLNFEHSFLESIGIESGQISNFPGVPKGQVEYKFIFDHVFAKMWARPILEYHAIPRQIWNLTFKLEDFESGIKPKLNDYIHARHTAETGEVYFTSARIFAIDYDGYGHKITVRALTDNKQGDYNPRGQVPDNLMLELPAPIEITENQGGDPDV